MKFKIYSKTIITITAVILMNLVFLTASSQNAVKSTPLGIGKVCGGAAITDSFRLMTYNNASNSMTVTYKCKPKLGGGTPSGPAFSSGAGSIGFNPKDQKVYYIATSAGNSYVYSWVPNLCPSVTQVYDYYYAGQFIVGVDFDPNSPTGDGYQLGFTGSTAPYPVVLRKVNFAGSYLGPNVSVTMPAGKKIYQQNGDIIFTPEGQLYFAFDNKLFGVNYSNYGSGTVTATYIDTLVFPTGYNLTGISYAAGKFIGSTQKSSGSPCSFYSIDISSGLAVINPVTLAAGNNYTATDMATLINGIGVAKKVYSVTQSGLNWIVQYDIKVRNFGNSILNNVQVVENLAAVFGAMVNSVSVAAVGTLPTGLALNSSFNGVSNTNIFVGGSSSILNTSPADSATVRVTFTLNNPSTSTTYYSSSIGSATDKLFGTSISDSSNNDAGLRSDLNSNGLPDDANEDIPTPLRIADWIFLANNIIDFNGHYADKKVNLHWSMLNTESGLTVNIQRSSDKNNFQTLGTLPIKESNSKETYSWADNLPLANDNFYRLEFVRPNGSSFYSEILAISLKNIRPKELIVSPNPFSDRVYFSINLESTQKVQYKLMGMDSKLIASGEKTGMAGNNKFSIDNLPNIPAGTYFLQAIVGDEVLHKVILKSH